MSVVLVGLDPTYPGGQILSGDGANFQILSGQSSGLPQSAIVVSALPGSVLAGLLGITPGSNGGVVSYNPNTKAFRANYFSSSGSIAIVFPTTGNSNVTFDVNNNTTNQNINTQISGGGLTPSGTLNFVPGSGVTIGSSSSGNVTTLNIGLSGSSIGTVTSVGLVNSSDNLFTILGSPITTSGSFTLGIAQGALPVTKLTPASTGTYQLISTNGTISWNNAIAVSTVTLSSSTLAISPTSPQSGNVIISVNAAPGEWPINSLVPAGNGTFVLTSTNGTISWGSGGGGTVSSVTAGDASLLISPTSGPVIATLGTTIPGDRTFSGTLTLNGTTGGYSLILGASGINMDNNAAKNAQVIQFTVRGQTDQLSICSNASTGQPQANEALVICDAYNFSGGLPGGNIGYIYDSHFNPVTGDSLAGSGSNGLVLGYNSAQPNKLQWIANGGGSGVSNITFSNSGINNAGVVLFQGSTVNPTISSGGQTVSAAMNTIGTSLGQFMMSTATATGAGPSGLFQTVWGGGSGARTTGMLPVWIGGSGLCNWQTTLTGQYTFSGATNTFQAISCDHITATGTSNGITTNVSSASSISGVGLSSGAFLTNVTSLYFQNKSNAAVPLGIGCGTSGPGDTGTDFNSGGLVVFETDDPGNYGLIYDSRYNTLPGGLDALPPYKALTGDVGAPAQLQSNTPYIATANLSATRVVYHLPTNPSVGDCLEVVGLSVAGWRIQCVGTQGIVQNSVATNAAGSNYVQSTLSNDNIKIVCQIGGANSSWSVVSSQGNLNYQ